MAINNWMDDLDDNLELCQIVMPGSHDAGMWEVHGGGAAWDSWVITHDRDATGQLDAGCRFFDFRIFNKNTFGTTTINDLYFGHFAEPKRGRAAFGRYGAKVQPTLAAIKVWIENNPSEVVYLRFSHIKSGNRSVAIQAIKTELGTVLYKSSKRRDTDNHAHQILGNLRGHVVAIFDVGDSFTEDSRDGIITYKSYKKVDVIPQCTGAIFLQLCGEYSNEDNYGAMLPKQQARHEEHRKHVVAHNSSHLHVIYFTFTSGTKNIKTMTEQYNDRLAAFLNEFVTEKATGHGCNIVMMDFINPDKCSMVVNKGNGLKLKYKKKVTFDL